MHTVIFKYSDHKFNISTVELEALLKRSYYDKFTTHTNGSQRQINCTGIDTFSIVTPHCLDTAMELVKQYKFSETSKLCEFCEYCEEIEAEPDSNNIRICEVCTERQVESLASKGQIL